MFEWFWSRPTPDKIYSSRLEVLGLGYALWRPEPDAAGEPHICDVGFVRQGKFIRLLNFDVHAPEKSVTFWRPPINYIEPLPPDALMIDRTPNFLSAGYYSSHGVQSASAHASLGVTAAPSASAGVSAGYTFKGSHGAALILSSTADYEDIVSSTILKRYIIRNYESWLVYALEARGLDLKQKDLVVVSGCSKTAPDWRASVFGLRRTKAASLSLGVHAGPAAAEMGGSSTFFVTSSSIHRQGPGPNSAHGEEIEDAKKDHCVAIRRLKIRTRFPTMSKIVAGAGYHQLPGPSDGDEDSSNAVMAAEPQEDPTDSLWGVVRESGDIPDRLDVLLDYMLEISEARAVIASDNDVERILGARLVLDFSSFLRQVGQVIVQVTDGVGYIQIEGLVRQEQMKKFETRRFVKEADVIQWPNITLRNAGNLKDCDILHDGSQSNARSIKYKTVTFGDPKTMPINHQDTVALSDDGKLLAAAIGTVITVWRLQDGLAVQQLERDGHTGTITRVAFSPDGQHIISGAKDKIALVWNVRTGNIVRRLKGHTKTIYHVVFSPNNMQIATSSKDSLRVWNASSGDLLHVITDLHSRGYEHMLFSPDSSHLAARSDASHQDTAVVVLNCHTGERIATLRKQYIHCMVLSSEGDRLTTGSLDGTASVWDLASGKALLELKDHTGAVREVAFSPDGREVATASDDGTVVTRDSRSGERRFTFRLQSVRGSEKESVYAVAYSARNNFIACGADDGCVRVWSCKTGLLVATFQGHSNWVKHVLFTPDGWDVLSYGNDSVVRLWSIRDALRIS